MTAVTDQWPQRAIARTGTVFEQTLFQRLEAPEDVIRPKGEVDPSAVADSVLANLRHILNSREGCCEARVDFGIPDFNDYIGNFPDAIPKIGQAIQFQITQFEPRLAHPVVRHIPSPESPLTLMFHIVADLVVGDERRHLAFDTVLGDDGYMRIVG